MPQPKVVLDYQRCDPYCSEDGICPASLVCERKVLTQEGPGELPDLHPAPLPGLCGLTAALSYGRSAVDEMKPKDSEIYRMRDPER